MGPQNSRNQNMQGKKNEEKKQIKKPDTSNVKFGKKRKKKKGLDLTAKLPNGKNVFNKVPSFPPISNTLSVSFKCK